MAREKEDLLAIRTKLTEGLESSGHTLRIETLARLPKQFQRGGQAEPLVNPFADLLAQGLRLQLQAGDFVARIILPQIAQICFHNGMGKEGADR